MTSYDDNGNIVGLNRGGTFLTYRYGSGNQLTSIVGGTLGGAFTYDGNGNELTDSRRGAILTYNQLNLPATVTAISDGTQHTASYVYDAAGSKLRSVQDTVTRDYIGGIQYTHGAIDFVQTDEGIAVRNPATGAYAYQYNLKDHLGNTRVTIDSDPSTGAARVIQEDEYYAFGLDVPKHRFGTENNYLYNGKEKQDVLVNMLDYGARFYDPVIARWTSVDPKAELMRRYSPYNYGFNNPLRFIDPDGRGPEDWILFDGKTIQWYGGNIGDKTHLLATFKGTSGQVGYQNSNQQNKEDYGPIPEGKYDINLQPNPERIASVDKNTGQLNSNPQGGIEEIPYYPKLNNGNYAATTPAWGNTRAKLDPQQGTNLLGRKDSFYFHDSHKGYTHGCVECQTGLINKLKQYRTKGNKKIDVQVQYKDKNTSTNGGTKSD